MAWIEQGHYLVMPICIFASGYSMLREHLHNTTKYIPTSNNYYIWRLFFWKMLVQCSRILTVFLEGGRYMVIGCLCRNTLLWKWKVRSTYVNIYGYVFLLQWFYTMRILINISCYYVVLFTSTSVFSNTESVTFYLDNLLNRLCLIRISKLRMINVSSVKWLDPNAAFLVCW